MLVIIKSAPATPEGKRAFRLAEDMGADICLIQNAVYFCLGDRCGGFTGKVYVLEEDMKLRGIVHEGNAQSIDYGKMVDLIAEKEKVIGMF